MKQIGKNMDIKNLVERNKLVKAYAGSHAYGTTLPTSDVDFRGIFCADPINILTPFFPVREYDDANEEDTKYFELSHFMKLCLDCNPNIIETLWVNDEDITFRTPAYDLLRENRHKLLSSKIAFTTSGYALAQLKRIRGHHKWINQPQPKDPPQPKDFVSMIQNFSDSKLMPRDFSLDMFRNGHRLVQFSGEIYGIYYSKDCQTYDVYGNLNTVFEGEQHEIGTPQMIIKFNKEEYKSAKEKHNQYWTWKKKRNKTRSELEEHFGYDSKHAMHLVRLLRMGVEALTKEEIIVKRPDATELLEIRDGSWTYDQVVTYAENMDELVRNEYYKTTNLPKRPDIKFAAALLMEVQNLVWKQ